MAKSKSPTAAANLETNYRGCGTDGQLIDMRKRKTKTMNSAFLRPEVLPKVTEQIGRGEFSIRALAKSRDATTVCLPREWLPQLRNVNTLADWE